jgi:tripartite-type tricarboxylate transporter receptor subunit TctC
VTVENRGGAGGISGSEAAARVAPDGYTFLIADVGQAVDQPLPVCEAAVRPGEGLRWVGRAREYAQAVRVSRARIG